MTNKTEDKFYFGKSGQPKRFGIGNKDTMATLSEFEKLLKPHWDVLYHGESKLSGTHDPRNPDNQYRYEAKRAIADFVDACVAGPQFAKRIIDDIRVRVNQYIDQGRDKSVPQYRNAVQIAKALDAIRGPLKSGFSRPGQPERFEKEYVLWGLPKGKTDRLHEKVLSTKAKTPAQMDEIKRRAAKDGWHSFRVQILDLSKPYTGFSRPGQPERFAREVIARKGNKRVELSGPNGNGNWVVTVMEENKQVVPGEVNERFVDSKFYSTEAGARRAASKMLASRPGQPERFDASSLDRKGFAEASSSPMLGKLLSEKQMPEGGWRAVETGGGALVISFEDADVAGNFARRVAGSGYSATAPVQSIGRYWNVEVKNG